MSAKQKVTVAYGDGIGPEIMQAAIDILIAAGAQIETEVIEIGEKVFRKGISTGISDESWDIIKKNIGIPKSAHHKHHRGEVLKA